MTVDLRLPIGPFDRLKKFGHPWHGVVKSGELLLPNGSRMPYPQPAGEWEYAGISRVVGVGAPPVDTTPEEAAAGQVWRNVATLSGEAAQLYSRGIGIGAWVYCDPAGVRWRVTTDAEGRTPAQIGAAIRVTLTRFGELGGAAEAYTYTVSGVSLDQAGPEVIGEPVARCIDSSPDRGRGAIFSFDLPRMYAHCAQPCGFFEVRLDGLGQSCSVTVILLNGRASALGTATGAVPVIQETVTWISVQTTYDGVQQDYPVCSGSRTRTDTPVLTPAQPATGYARGYFETPFVGTIESGIEDMVLARYYRADGSIGSITCTQAYVGDITAPPAALVDIVAGVTVTTYNGVSGSNCAVTVVKESELAYKIVAESAADERLSVAIRVDGAEHAALTVRSQFAKTESRRLGEMLSLSQTKTQTPGGTLTSSVVSGDPERWPRSDAPLILLWSLSALYFPSDFRLRQFTALGVPRQSWVVEGGRAGGLCATLYRFAPLLWGFVFESSRDGAEWIVSTGSALASPYGPHSHPAVAHEPAVTAALETKLEGFYGSVCPVTGDAAIDLVPVCWV